MGNLLRDPVKRNNQGYNSFPMHQWNYFTCSVGQAIPFFYDFLQPGDHIKIGTAMYNRMTTLLSASPIELTNHVQYFFVPLRYLYSIMPSLLTAVDDIKTTFVEKGNLQSKIPYIDLKSFYTYIASSFYDVITTDLDDEHAVIRDDRADVMGDSFWKGLRRVSQSLGYGDFLRYCSIASNVNSYDSIAISPLLACAYQLIYQDYFRIDERENLNAQLFNVDQFYNTPNLMSVADDGVAEDYFKLWYVPWKKDYYTNVDVSPLSSAGSKSIFGGEDNDTFNFVKQWLASDVDTKIVDPNNFQQPADILGNGSNVLFADNSVAGNQAHRVAAVLEKFASIVGGSDKNYRDQIQALYGFTPPKFTSNMCDRIGYDSMPLKVYEIVSDATTGLPTDEAASQLGDVAGKSVSYKDSKRLHSYTAPEHGFLIAIAFTTPNAVYGCKGLDKINTYLQRTDFPNPLFDRLGQEPLFLEQVNMRTSAYVNSWSVGWIYRHQELKQKYDRAFGGFAGSLKYWIPQRDEIAYSQYVHDALRPYYISPWYINDILLTPYGGGVEPAGVSNATPYYYFWFDHEDLADDNPQVIAYMESIGMGTQRRLYGDHLFDSDPLMNFYKVNYVKSSKMDVYGIPKNLL